MKIAALRKICEGVGVEWVEVEDVPPARPIEPGDIADNVNGIQLSDGAGYLRLSDAWRGGVFEEIGTPGTPITGGIIQQEPTAKYGPYQVRGFGGYNALYEELYRQEPVLFEGINELNNLWMSGKLSLDIPDLPRSQRGTAEEFVAYTNRWLGNIWRGIPYYLQHVGAARIFGFYTFETVWDVDWKGRLYPVKLAPREPSTVDKWIMNPRADELAAVTFQTAGTAGSGSEGGEDAPSTYTLTAGGPHLVDHRVHLVNINARANNFEGISLIRPIIHWVKFKQALAQIAAVTAQKYGVPIAVIKEMPVTADMTYNSADRGDAAAVFDAINVIQSADGPVLQLPAGFDAQILSAQGAMPSLEALLEYADAQIAKPLNAETSLLANATVGSYALASVLDDRVLRAQPGFAAHVLQPLNWMVRDIGRFHGVELDAWPVFRWSMDGLSDGSRWIADATAAMGGLPMAQWPKEMQSEALRKLDLPPSTFDGFEMPEVAPAGPAMFRGADVHSCGHDHGDDEGWTPGVAPILAMSWDALRAGCHNEAPVLRMADKLQPVDERGMSAEAVDKQMDEIAARIARRINPIVVEHQRAFREVVRDGGVDPAVIADQMRDAFLPQYEAVFLEEMRRASDVAKRQLLRDYGFKVSSDARLPSRQQLEDAMKLQAFARATEVFNRQQGYMVDSRVADQMGMKADGVPKLKKSTLARVAAGAASVAYAAGRDDLIEKAAEDAPDAPRVMAYRSSMLDRNVCEECLMRDFEAGTSPAVHAAGSSAYYDDMPPNYCLGGPSRCRCVYIYEIPEELAGTLEEIAAAQGFDLPGGF